MNKIFIEDEIYAITVRLRPKDSLEHRQLYDVSIRTTDQLLVVFKAFDKWGLETLKKQIEEVLE